MASRADIEAGKAFVLLYLDDKRFHSGLQGATRTLVDFTTKALTLLNPAHWLGLIGDAVAGLGKRIALGSGAMAAATIPLIRAASSQVETLNKFQAVFGSQSAAATIWIDKLTDRVGRSKVDTMNALAAYQAFFVGMGIGREEADKLSKTMGAAAIDMSSFFNVSDQEANERFLSALAGSVQVLDMFGMNLRETAVQAELSAMGINKAWQDVTEPEKAMARVRVIQRAMAAQGATGDAERTAGSLQNLWRKLSGQLQDLAGSIGTALVPVVTPLIQKVSDLATAFAKWARQHPALIATVGKLVVGLAGFGLALIAVGKALSVFATAMTVVWILGKVALVLPVVLPLLLKLVSALRLFALGWGALKLAMTAMLPAMAKAVLLFGGLTLAVTAVAAVWANAKMQGISFGESVLDLTNRITGLSNAYSRLRESQTAQKTASEAIAAVEESMNQVRREYGIDGARPAEETPAPSGPLASTDAELTKLKEQRLTAMARTAKETDPLAAKDARIELARIDAAIERFTKDRAELQTKVQGKLEAAKSRDARIKSLIGSFKHQSKLLASSAAGTLGGGLTTYAALIEQTRDLDRMRAEGIADPRERERALTNFDFDARVRDARREGKPTKVIELTRQQALANIDAEHARQAAEERKRLEERTADEIAKLRIENTKKGYDKELALLKLRQEKELEEARKVGADMETLRQKHSLEQQGLRIQEQAHAAETTARGTFSGYEAQAMGGGSIQQRLLQAAQRQAGDMAILRGIWEAFRNQAVKLVLAGD